MWVTRRKGFALLMRLLGGLQAFEGPLNRCLSGFVD